MKRIENRPWGKYEILYDWTDCKVKKITVNAGQKISYQYHHKRQEQWVLVKGTLTVIRDGEEYTLDNAGESFTIPMGSKHRAWNKTDEVVEFIEVQTGTYFGEDDIVRIEDDYNRI